MTTTESLSSISPPPPPLPYDIHAIQDKISYYLGSEVGIVLETNAIVESIATQNERLSHTNLVKDIQRNMRMIIHNLEEYYGRRDYQMYDRMQIVDFLGEILILESHLESLETQHAQIFDVVGEFRFNSDESATTTSAVSDTDMEIKSLIERTTTDLVDFAEVERLLFPLHPLAGTESTTNPIETTDTTPLRSPSTFGGSEVPRLPIHSSHREIPFFSPMVESPTHAVEEEEQQPPFSQRTVSEVFRELGSSPVVSDEDEEDVNDGMRDTPLLIENHHTLLMDAPETVLDRDGDEGEGEREPEDTTPFLLENDVLGRGEENEEDDDGDGDDEDNNPLLLLE